MESFTKNRQTPRTLRAMVERAYGRDRVPSEDGQWWQELGQGWFNVIYRIRLRDGAHVVLKIAPPSGVEVMTYERAAMATELAALDLIRRRTSVPVPAIDLADDSLELCDAPWFAMPFIHGDNLDVIRDHLPEQDLERLHEAVGRITRDLNAIRGTAFGELGACAGAGAGVREAGAPILPTWREVFMTMVEGVLRDGERRGVDLGRPYATVRQVVAEHGECLEDVREPQFVEWDLWDGNVLVHEGRIVGIIDHERAFFGDPLIESGFCGTQLPTFGDSTAFVRGYGWGEFSQRERIRRRLYCLYLVLIMIIETTYRGRPEDPRDEWSRQYGWARARLIETLALFGRTGT
jgi:aminoglycoside phosphotransferase (APT) family kinase protein